MSPSPKSASDEFKPYLITFVSSLIIYCWPNWTLTHGRPTTTQEGKTGAQRNKRRKKSKLETLQRLQVKNKMEWTMYLRESCAIEWCEHTFLRFCMRTFFGVAYYHKVCPLTLWDVCVHVTAILKSFIWTDIDVYTSIYTHPRSYVHKLVPLSLSLSHSISSNSGFELNSMVSFHKGVKEFQVIRLNYSHTHLTPQWANCSMMWSAKIQIPTLYYIYIYIDWHLEHLPVFKTLI